MFGGGHWRAGENQQSNNSSMGYPLQSVKQQTLISVAKGGNRGVISRLLSFQKLPEKKISPSKGIPHPPILKVLSLDEGVGEWCS
jgi:hypothetical protein